MSRTIKINFDDGDYIITRINATVSEIVNYYLDRIRITENADGTENITRARSIEFLDHNNARNYWNGKRQELKRIYSISEDFMKRHELTRKFRFTLYEYEPDNFSPKPRYTRHDAAYLDGSLANFN